MDQLNKKTDTMRLEILRLKLQKTQSTADKLRVQHLQQELDNIEYEKKNTKDL
jgi:hypothetical protein